MIGTAICRSLQTPKIPPPPPRNPEIPKSLKNVFSGRKARSVKKVSKKPPNTRKKVESVSKRGLFRHFFDTPGRKARERLFETLGDFGARNETFVCGGSNRNSLPFGFAVPWTGLHGGGNSDPLPMSS